MSKLTLDEAIKRCLEAAAQEECFINYPHSDIVLDDLDIESHKNFAAEQRQIAKWLTELKEARIELNRLYPILEHARKLTNEVFELRKK